MNEKASALRIDTGKEGIQSDGAGPQYAEAQRRIAPALDRPVSRPPETGVEPGGGSHYIARAYVMAQRRNSCEEDTR